MSSKVITVDCIFIDESFDVFTQAFYLKILRNLGKDAYIAKNDKNSQIRGFSKDKIKQCRDLLVFCNIIKIYRIKRTKDNFEVGNTVQIQIVNKDQWHLDHEYRDAYQYSIRLDA